MLRVTQLSGFGIGAGAPSVATKLLSAGGASYSLAGSAATLQPSNPVHKILGAGGGSYSLTGTAANLNVGIPPGSEAAAFLARTSGLNTTHINAYTALINGLVADAVWTKLDVLHVYATQDSTTALLNLKSSSFTGTINGSPTFTVDRGFTGVETSATVYIDTNFNMVGGLYVQNSAHLSAWITTNGQGTGCLGWYYNATGNQSYLVPRSTGDIAAIRLNDNASGTTVASTDSRGHWLENRSGGSASQLYKNGSSILTNTTTSIGLAAVNIHSLGWNVVGGNHQGYGQQMAMISIGSSLNSTEATNFYNRLRTYMTAVGVP